MKKKHNENCFSTFESQIEMDFFLRIFSKEQKINKRTKLNGSELEFVAFYYFHFKYEENSFHLSSLCGNGPLKMEEIKNLIDLIDWFEM